jgi:hypothetical protein
MADETTPKSTDATSPEESPEATKEDKKPAAKPAAKAKKEKPPALEDKPFPEFITQHFMPKVKEALAKQGITDLELVFEKQPYPVEGLAADECWQVMGRWDGGQRQFILGFSKEDIAAPKFFCAADKGAAPSVLESFMIDERRVNLDLMVLYTVQRLNAQKWLVRN